MTHLKELVERVKAAVAPYPQLDEDVLTALEVHSWAGRMSVRVEDQPFWKDMGSSAVTSSLDAARALASHFLSGWHQASGTVGENDGPWACLTEPDGHCRDFTGAAATEPLSIIAALLTALSESRHE